MKGGAEARMSFDLQLVNECIMVLVMGKQNVKMPFRRMRNRRNRESDHGTVLGRHPVQPSAATTDTEDKGGMMAELSMKILFSDVLH